MLVGKGTEELFKKNLTSHYELKLGKKCNLKYVFEWL